MSRIDLFPAVRIRTASVYFSFRLAPLLALPALGLASSSAPSSPPLLLALLNDFGLGPASPFLRPRLPGLFFFDLERDDVRQHAFGLGDQLDLGGVYRQCARANCALSIRPLNVHTEFRGNVRRKHSTSTSRVTTSKTPPCTFTPAGSPNRMYGNFHAHAHVHGHAQKNPLEQFPETGSTSNPSGSPARAAAEIHLKQRVVSASERRIAATCLALDRQGDGLALPPYNTAGTSGLAAAADASFLPRVLRGGSHYNFFCFSACPSSF